jgi:type IV pilus assembly protein PilQ
MGPPSRVGFHVEYYNGLISLDVSNGNLDDVIKAIADQGDMEVVTYGNLTGEVNAVLNGVPLSEALTLLLGGTKFTFVQKDNVILIGDRNTATPSGQALSKSEIVHLRHIKADEVPKILPKNIPVNNVKVVKEQNALLVSGTSEDIVKTREFLATVDIPTPQVILDAIVVEYSRQLDRDFGLEVGTSHPRKSRHSYFTYPESEVNLRGRDAKALLKWPFNKGTDIVTKIGELTDSFYINLRMLERQQKAKVLAQPSITVLNGNKAQINVGQTQYYTIEGGTADNPTRDFKPISFGIRLDITPWISQSGQITAEISPDISNSMGVNEAGYPNVFRRSIKTTVQIDDGKTLVLGGLLRTEQQETQRKVPILGDIPLLGYLFRSTLKNNIQTNLVIYITPHIIEKGTKMDMAEELQKLDREERGHLFGPSFIDGIDNHLRHVDDEEKDSISPPPLPVEQPETGGRGAEDSNVSESDAELPEQKEVSQRN